MLKHVRFRVVLPIVMVVLSATLMSFYQYQHWRIARSGTGYIEPAGNINYFLNGPAVAFWGFNFLPYGTLGRVFGHNEGKLPTVALMWFLIGWAIDRRRQGRDFAKEYPKFALPMFGILAATSWWISFAVGRYLFGYGEHLWKILSWSGLWTTVPARMALAVWMLFLGLYFTKRALIAGLRLWRERSQAHSTTPRAQEKGRSE